MLQGSLFDAVELPYPQAATPHERFINAISKLTADEWKTVLARVKHSEKTAEAFRTAGTFLCITSWGEGSDAVGLTARRAASTPIDTPQAGLAARVATALMVAHLLTSVQIQKIYEPFSRIIPLSTLNLRLATSDDSED